jgi:hypothetical protein
MDCYTNEYPHPGTKVLLLLFNRRNKSLTPPYLMDYYTNEYPHPGTKVLLLLFNRRNKSLTPPYLMDYYTNEYPHPGTKVLLLLFNRSVSVAIRQTKQTYVYNIHISFSQSFCFNNIFTASKHHFIASKYHFTNKSDNVKRYTQYT